MKYRIVVEYVDETPYYKIQRRVFPFIWVSIVDADNAPIDYHSFESAYRALESLTRNKHKSKVLAVYDYDGVYLNEKWSRTK